MGIDTTVIPVNANVIKADILLSVNAIVSPLINNAEKMYLIQRCLDVYVDEGVILW